MGATDTSTDARNVVGPGAEPTVAPASGEKTVAEQSLTVVDGGLTETRTTSVHGAAAARPLHELAYDLVEQPKRLKVLAALLGEAEGALRAALVHPDSRIELANAGWVRRKA
jgi:hypothetical protein